MSVVTWNEKNVLLSELRPFERNPRKISRASYKRLKDAIGRVGYHQRILATQDLRIIGGHQRLSVLKELGFTNISVLVPSKPLSDDEFRRLLIEDNLSFGEFDALILQDDYSKEELVKWGFPEEQAMWGEENDIPPEAEAAVPIESVAVTTMNDIWLCGPHRIRCGDSTKREHVEKLLDGTVPHLMVTDPPYGVKYDANWRNNTKRLRLSARAIGKVKNDDRSDWSEAWVLFPGDVAYVWHSGIYAPEVAESIRKAKFELRSQIIWAKSQLVIGRGHYHTQHESCFYAVREGSTGHWVGDRKQTTLWSIDKPRKSETGHSTQKPIECMKRPLENNSVPGDAIYEPFSGSGTTLIACELTSRRCFAMELDALYVDMAVRRWQKFTGAQAVRAGDHVTFDEAAAARAA